MTQTAERPKRPPFHPWKFLTAVLIGVAGGTLFWLMGMPLPWLLGPMVANTIAALAGAPIQAPVAIRPYVVVVIGVMLGSGFTPALLENIGGWSISLAAVGLYLFVGSLVTVPFYRRVGKLDPATAYFCGMPGGVNEMIVIGGAYGGDEKRIALAHAARVLIVVMLLAFWFRHYLEIDMSQTAARALGLADVPPRELAKLTLAGALGFLLGRRLRLPAPTLVGPMLLSGALYLSGFVTMAPPFELVIAAQVLLGSIIGCRFIGERVGTVLHTFALGIGATILLLGVTVVFVVVLSRFIGVDVLTMLLGFSPGGFAEMSLIALALDGDVAYVAAHHVARIGLVVLFAPLFFRLFAGRSDSRK